MQRPEHFVAFADMYDMTAIATSPEPGDQPCVTWLLSVRNGLPYLTKALESIAGQTYKNHKILVWDDASTDGTADELRRWIPSRIPGTIFTGQRLRLGLNLAFLVEQADTEFCARIDAEDVNLPHRLERQVDFLRQHPEVGVAGSNVSLIDGNEHPCGIWKYPESDAEVRWNSCWQAMFCHSSVMFRRSAVLKAGNYRNAPMMEGLDLWMRMITHTEMRNLEDILLHHRPFGPNRNGKLQNFFPTDRDAAALNMARLFPNVTRRSRAMRLWIASHPGRLQQTSAGSSGIFAVHNPAEQVWNIHALKQMAVLLAKKAGKAPDYFTRSETFRSQHFHMWRELGAYCGLGSLLALSSRLGSSVNVASPAVLAHKG